MQLVSGNSSPGSYIHWWLSEVENITSSKVRLMVSSQAHLGFRCKTCTSANHKDVAGAPWRQKRPVSLLLRGSCGPEGTVDVGGCRRMKHYLGGFWRVLFLQKASSPPTDHSSTSAWPTVSGRLLQISTVCTYHSFQRHQERPSAKKGGILLARRECDKAFHLPHINSDDGKVSDPCHLQAGSPVEQYHQDLFKTRSCHQGIL